jgi:intraflagellar transport protein 52
MSVNADGVARTEFFKYTHPKEALISTGILNREINRAAGKRGVTSGVLPPDAGSYDPTFVVLGVNWVRNLSFVYPFGATINVQKPAVPILSSGSTSYPFNRPIGACYVNPVFLY